MTVSYLLMLQKVFQFKAKDSEIKDYTLYLGNISKDFTINSIKKKKKKFKGIANFFLLILIIFILTVF